MGPARMSEEAEKPVGRPHWWLLLLPFVWQVALAPFVNDIAWRPFGLPFPMVWQMAGIVFTSTLIAIVFRIDNRIDAEIEDPATDERPVH